MKEFKYGMCPECSAPVEAETMYYGRNPSQKQIFECGGIISNFENSEAVYQERPCLNSPSQKAFWAKRTAAAKRVKDLLDTLDVDGKFKGAIILNLLAD